LQGPGLISQDEEVQQRFVELVEAQTLKLTVLKADGTVLANFTKRATDHNIESRRCSIASEKLPTYRLLIPQVFPVLGTTRPNWNPLGIPLFPSISRLSPKEKERVLKSGEGMGKRLIETRGPEVFILDEPVQFSFALTMPINAVALLHNIYGEVTLEGR